MFFCATFVVETNFVNIDFFLLVISYSTCSYSIFLLDILEKLINIDFWIWHNDILLIKLEKNAPVNHFKESNITL